jgi:hypothetical protein
MLTFLPMQSFLVVVGGLSILLSTALLLVGWRLTRGRFNVLPSGPFAVIFAILYVPVLLVRPVKLTSPHS